MLWWKKVEAVIRANTHPKRQQVSHEALIQASADLQSEICFIRAKPPEYDVNTISSGGFLPFPHTQSSTQIKN